LFICTLIPSNQSHAILSLREAGFRSLETAHKAIIRLAAAETAAQKTAAQIAAELTAAKTAFKQAEANTQATAQHDTNTAVQQANAQAGAQAAQQAGGDPAVQLANAHAAVRQAVVEAASRAASSEYHTPQRLWKFLYIVYNSFVDVTFAISPLPLIAGMVLFALNTDSVFGVALVVIMAILAFFWVFRLFYALARFSGVRQ